MKQRKFLAAFGTNIGLYSRASDLFERRSQPHVIGTADASPHETK